MRALVFSIDDAYVMPFKVLWHSLMSTESVPENASIFVLHAETLSNPSILDLQHFLKRYSRAASFMDARRFVPDDVPLSHHITKATYFRLYLASILPPHVTSAIYLDSDAITLRSIRDLFDWNLTHAVAAVDHLSPGNCVRLWGELSGNYFQAGVFLIDLEAWRLNQSERDFGRILSEHRDRIVWWDQDVLNIAFENNWQRLPVWYNLCAQARTVLGPEAVGQYGRFLHLDGSGKPWKNLSSQWHATQWYRAYFNTFGEEFDKGLIRKPLWRRSAAVARRFLKLASGQR